MACGSVAFIISTHSLVFLTNPVLPLRVAVYCPWTLRIESSEATDPYSVSLAADGERSQARNV